MSEPIYYSDTRGRNLFGYNVRESEGHPIFREGDIAVVNPNLSARNGDYVLARGNKGCALMLYLEGPSGPMLVGPGSGEPPCPAGDFVLLGRVVERKRTYN